MPNKRESKTWKFLPAIAALLVCLPIAQYALAQQTLRVDVNLINVFVTVQNSSGAFVKGLKTGDFRIYEDSVEQSIDVFEKDDTVKSTIGVLVDNSLSVIDILPMMRTGLIDFAERFKGFQDMFVMTFGTRVRLLHDIGQPVSHFETELKNLRAFGGSVFFDGLIEGMRKASLSDRDRKALIVFTDGFDNGSEAEFRDVLLEAQRSGVLLYFIPIGARILLDEHTLESLARDTGGRVVYLEKKDRVAPAMDMLREELAMQYYIGYYTARKPGFHQIRVEVPGRELRIRAKTGYNGG